MSISACNNFNRCSLKIPGESSIGAQFYSARFTWYMVDLNHGYEWLCERIPGLCSSVSITRKIEKKGDGREREEEREKERESGRQREKQRGMKRDEEGLVVIENQKKLCLYFVGTDFQLNSANVAPRTSCGISIKTK